MGNMPANPESPAETADLTVENDYDSFAEAYTVENDTSLINAYYARPAVVDLAGDVAGRRILDAGCGAGAVSVALRERGAVVSGFDRSTRMVELARQRLGDDVDLRVADIGEPLPYPDGAFDDVVAALVLHYLQDWSAPLAELRRVLTPGGRLIVVVNHPILLKMVHRETDYFATTKWSDDNDFNGQKAVLTYWHRPLHAMTDAFTAAGFRIAVVSEPHPAPEALDRFPDLRAQLPPSGAFLSFLFFVLEAVQE
jgi:ubiquinone/menaquinone biosynthesis C-methylase UbiE